MAKIPNRCIRSACADRRCCTNDPLDHPSALESVGRRAPRPHAPPGPHLQRSTSDSWLWLLALASGLQSEYIGYDSLPAASGIVTKRPVMRAGHVLDWWQVSAEVVDCIRLLIDALFPSPRSELRVWVGGHDRVVKRALVSALTDTLSPPAGELDAVFVAANGIDEAAYFTRKVWPRLQGGGSLCLILSKTGFEAADSDSGDSDASGDWPPAVAKLITELTSDGWRAASTHALGDSHLAVVCPPTGQFD